MILNRASLTVNGEYTPETAYCRDYCSMKVQTTEGEMFCGCYDQLTDCPHRLSADAFARIPEAKEIILEAIEEGILMAAGKERVYVQVEHDTADDIFPEPLLITDAAITLAAEESSFELLKQEIAESKSGVHKNPDVTALINTAIDLGLMKRVGFFGVRLKAKTDSGDEFVTMTIEEAAEEYVSQGLVDELRAEIDEALDLITGLKRSASQK